ncbi:hypothetical protein ACH4FA_05765 [Streptomyces sp. NPDC017966]
MREPALTWENVTFLGSPDGMEDGAGRLRGPLMSPRRTPTGRA